MTEIMVLIKGVQTLITGLVWTDFGKMCGQGCYLWFWCGHTWIIHIECGLQETIV